MNTTLESVLQGLQQGMWVALSFLDELLLFGFSHLGVNLPWMHWLCPLLSIVSLVVLTVRLWRWRRQAQVRH